MARPPAAEYAFVQDGGFSKVNEKLRTALDGQLYSCVGSVVDVKEHRRFTRGVVLNTPPRNVRATIKEFGPLFVYHPRRAITLRRFTAFMFDHNSRIAHQRIAESHPWFVFQTQVVFNAHLPGVPFLFIPTIPW